MRAHFCRKPVGLERHNWSVIFRQVPIWLGLSLWLFGSLPAAAKDAVSFGRGLLWMVETSGPAPNYVFGTIHVSDWRVTTLATPVREALLRAKSVLLELEDIGDALNTGRSELIQMFQLPPSRKLSGILGDELFERVRIRLGRGIVAAKDLDRIKPWALWFLFGDLDADELTSSRTILDRRLRAIGLSRGVPVFGLETMEEQIRALDGISEADQVKVIRQAISMPAQELRQQRERLITLYLDRNLRAIMTLYRNPRFVGGITFMKALRIERNKVMAERMDTHLRAGGAFVAVGAAHLPGEEGILNLLAERGYRVKRLY